MLLLRWTIREWYEFRLLAAIYIQIFQRMINPMRCHHTGPWMPLPTIQLAVVYLRRVGLFFSLSIEIFIPSRGVHAYRCRFHYRQTIQRTHEKQLSLAWLTRNRKHLRISKIHLSQTVEIHPLNYPSAITHSLRWVAGYVRVHCGEDRRDEKRELEWKKTWRNMPQYSRFAAKCKVSLFKQ